MKKLLSVLLSAVMIFSAVVPFSALAETTQTATVQFSVFDGGVFTMEPQNIEVSADLSDKYSTGYKDDSTQPTILDATIAAHIAMFGEDFMSYAPLRISSSGWITQAFGESGSCSYRKNGVSEMNLLPTLSNNDYVEFMFYQDVTGYTDKYVSFDKRKVNISAGNTLTLSTKAEGYDSKYNIVYSPAKNLIVTVNGSDYGRTNNKGQISLTFSNVGTYKVTLKDGQKLDGAYIFVPYCEVTVTPKSTENTSNSLNGTQLSKYIDKEMSEAAKYVYNKTEFTISNAVDFLTYLNSGVTVSDSVKQAFVNSVKNNLSENNGKLYVNNNGTKSEDIGLYGAVILSLQKLGYNSKNFEGYNIDSAFEKIDLANTKYNPYYYRVAVEAANENFAMTLCDDLIKDYYQKGKGVNYFGYSCDNTAVFLTAISKYSAKYAAYVADAKKVIEKYTNANGAFYSMQYKNTNADSTALAMMAYSSIGDVNTAFNYYKNLVENFEYTTGKFTYNGQVNTYATKDSLIALEYFRSLVSKLKFEHPQEVGKREVISKATLNKNGMCKINCVICGKTVNETIYSPKKLSLASKSVVYTGKAITQNVTVTDSNSKCISSDYYTVSYKNNKKIGTATVVVTFKGLYSGTMSTTFAIVCPSTKIQKISTGKKSITAQWKKVAGVSAYQVQIATNKKFSKNKKTFKVSKKSTKVKIKKLKAKKVYYVRVRSYKIKNGKKVYSKWSTVRKVKTK